jgi:hypothetical protein
VESKTVDIARKASHLPCQADWRHVMSNKELAEITSKALEAFRNLPAKERIQALIASGTIDAQGRVLMGEVTDNLNITSSANAQVIGPDGAVKQNVNTSDH